MATAIVAGALANKPLNGGEAWVRLTWALGLLRLGVDTHLVEQIAPEDCVDTEGRSSDFEDSLNRHYFERVVHEFGLDSRASLVCGDRTSGTPRDRLLDICREADVLVNISGHLRIEPLLQELRRKAYVDLDPGFTQFWHAAGRLPGLEGHDDHFTVGENIGSPGCPIPTGGLEWQPLPPPVLLDEWPAVPPRSSRRFTTVATWRPGHGPVEHNGVRYGLKVHEFRKLLELPLRADRLRFEIALDIHPGEQAEVAALRRCGWHVADPRTAVPDPATFRTYVQGSSAEFSVAQGAYVDTVSGWFSDRSVRYLASGRPVLLQDTGFSRRYPVDEGLLAFNDLEGAVEGAQRIERDHSAQCQAARALAERHFGSERVLGDFLARVGLA